MANPTPQPRQRRSPEKTDGPSPSSEPAPSLFPMFVKLEDRSCLVVGAGGLAESKIPGLLEAGASVGVVAPEANAAVSGWALSGKITWKQRSFEPADLDWRVPGDCCDLLERGEPDGFPRGPAARRPVQRRG